MTTRLIYNKLQRSVWQAKQISVQVDKPHFYTWGAAKEVLSER